MIQNAVETVGKKYKWKFLDNEEGILTREMDRFFRLVVKFGDFDNKVLVPSERLYTVWRECLMRPKEYYSYCMSIGNRIIDHDPSPSHAVERYINTRKYYTMEYKEEPPLFCWPLVDLIDVYVDVNGRTYLFSVASETMYEDFKEQVSKVVGGNFVLEDGGLRYYWNKIKPTNGYTLNQLGIIHGTVLKLKKS
jgi:hypothetical protein